MGSFHLYIWKSRLKASKMSSPWTVKRKQRKQEEQQGDLLKTTHNYWSFLSQLPIESSLLAGGTASIFFLEFIKTTYNTVTYIFSQAFDAILNDSKKESFKVKLSIENSNLENARVVRDGIGGLILHQTGLYYLDSLTMIFYQYKNPKKKVEGKETFVFKLAPYVHILYQRLNFNLKESKLNSMMNDVLLHMMLNDIFANLKQSQAITNYFSEDQKKAIQSLVNLIRRKESPQPENASTSTLSMGGLFRANSNQPKEKSSTHTTYEILKKWKEENSETIKQIFDTIAKSSAPKFSTFIKRNADRDYEPSSHLVNFLASEYITGNPQISIRLIEMKSTYESTSKFWKPLFQVSYEVSDVAESS